MKKLKKKITYRIPEILILLGAFVALGMIGTIQNKTTEGVSLQSGDAWATVIALLVLGGGVFLCRLRAGYIGNETEKALWQRSLKDAAANAPYRVPAESWDMIVANISPVNISPML